jgi:hypothetical protein
VLQAPPPPCSRACGTQSHDVTNAALLWIQRRASP